MPPLDVNRLDLLQGFIDVSIPAGPGTLTLRPGRQEIGLGSSRIVSVRNGPNVRQSFDGARLFWRDGSTRIDAFYVRPVETKRGSEAAHASALSPVIMVDMLGAESALFPLKNPAIVTIPLGFAVGILISLLRPEASARNAYDAKERRMIMGTD